MHNELTSNRQPTLVSERLVLRPFQLSDAIRVQTLAGDERIAQMTAHVPHPYEDGMAEQWIACHADNWSQQKAVVFAATLKESLELIGTVSLTQIANGEGNLGFWFGTQYWGKGFCTEAANTLIHFGFTQLMLNRVFAQHLKTNPASGRVMEKCSMTFINETVEMVHGREREVKHWEILA